MSNKTILRLRLLAQARKQNKVKKVFKIKIPEVVFSLIAIQRKRGRNKYILVLFNKVFWI